MPVLVLGALLSNGGIGVSRGGDQGASFKSV